MTCLCAGRNILVHCTVGGICLVCRQWASHLGDIRLALNPLRAAPRGFQIQASWCMTTSDVCNQQSGLNVGTGNVSFCNIMGAQRSLATS